MSWIELGNKIHDAISTYFNRLGEAAVSKEDLAKVQEEVSDLRRILEAKEPPITYTHAPTKPLSEIRASDVPMGMDPYDCALPQEVDQGGPGTIQLSGPSHDLLSLELPSDLAKATMLVDLLCDRELPGWRKGDLEERIPPDINAGVTLSWDPEDIVFTQEADEEDQTISYLPPSEILAQIRTAKQRFQERECARNEPGFTRIEIDEDAKVRVFVKGTLVASLSQLKLDVSSSPVGTEIKLFAALPDTTLARPHADLLNTLPYSTVALIKSEPSPEEDARERLTEALATGIDRLREES